MRDLLRSRPNAGATQHSLRVREHPKEGPYVQGISSKPRELLSKVRSRQETHPLDNWGLHSGGSNFLEGAFYRLFSVSWLFIAFGTYFQMERLHSFRQKVCFNSRRKPILLAFFSDLSKHLVVDYQDIKELMDKGNALR